jgi:hypothetical protein
LSERHQQFAKSGRFLAIFSEPTNQFDLAMKYAG